MKMVSQRTEMFRRGIFLRFFTKLVELGRKNTNGCHFTAEGVGYIFFYVDHFGKGSIAEMVFLLEERGR